MRLHTTRKSADMFSLGNFQVSRQRLAGWVKGLDLFCQHMHFLLVSLALYFDLTTHGVIDSRVAPVSLVKKHSGNALSRPPLSQIMEAKSTNLACGVMQRRSCCVFAFLL